MALEAGLRHELNNPEFSFIDRTDRAGFETAMANASEIIVTPDSITMVCEAYATRRPVTVFDLECTNENSSTARFITEFVTKGRITSLRKASTSVADKSWDEEIKQAMDAITLSKSQWQSHVSRPV